MSRRVDRAFARYRRRGHPDDLARVFDATAAKLYHLAWHLTGDRHAAEDLVQTTFLVAIEDAAMHEGDRPVLPWLCGILTNRARMRWRRLRVENGAPLEEASASDDPGEAAAVRELSSSVLARLRALPEPYRRPCVLHVEHGLAPQEIARMLGRNDGTVRSQLQRGLDMLRRALPAALGAGLRAAPPPNLAPLRAQVLASAANGAHVAPAVLAHAARSAHERTLRAVLTGAPAVVAVALGLAALRPLDEAPAVSVGPAASAEVPAEPLDHLEGGAVEPVQRDEVPPPPAVDPAALLLVRVRWDRDGTPAGGIAVRYVPAGDEGDLLERVVTTDSSGVARFESPRVGLATVHPDRGGSAEVRVHAAATTIADVVVPPGVSVQGRLLDEEDRPVFGGYVWLSHGSRSLCGGEIVARSGVDGTFTLRDVEPGRLLSAWSQRHAPTDVRPIGRDENGQQGLDLVFLLEEPGEGQVHGRVIDGQGVAVANAKVLLGTPRAAMPRVGVARVPPARLTSTDAEGRFLFVGLPLDGEVLRLRACAPGLALSETEVTMHASTQLTLVLREEAVVFGCALDRNGDPAWRGSVGLDTRELRQERARLPRWARLETAPARDGSFALRHLDAGRATLRAADGVDVAVATFDLTHGERRPWQAHMRELAIFGEVVDAHGERLAGWQVCAHSELAGRLDAFTDRHGRFRLEGADLVAYDLAVQEPDAKLELGGPAAVVRGVLPGPSPVPVVVAHDDRATARVRVGLDLPPHWRGDASVLLQQATEEGLRASTIRRLADGRYHSKLLRPGRYWLLCTTAGAGVRQVGPFDLVPDQELELGTVRLEPPGRFDVRIEGDAANTVRLVGWRSTEHSPGELSTLFAGAGRARSGPLQPGTYWVLTTGATMAGVRIEVGSGSVADAVLAVPRGRTRRLRFPPESTGDAPRRWRFFDAAGCLVHEIGGSRPQPERREATRSLAPGRYTVEAIDLHGAGTVREFTVEDSEDADVIELPAPPVRS